MAERKTVVELLHTWFLTLSEYDRKIVTSFMNERKYRAIIDTFGKDGSFPMAEMQEMLGKDE